jgi:N-acetylglutamate synthase-like GNAT family acetyltransferase
VVRVGPAERLNRIEAAGACRRRSVVVSDTLGSFSLRQAAPADWPAVARLLSSHGLPLAGAEANLPTTVLAVVGGEVVGCAAAEVHGAAVLLRSVAVAPGLHERGIGRALVGTVLDEARRRGLDTVHLLTTTAPDWFARFGFGHEPIGRAPASLSASAEFQGACPASADFMSLALREPRTASAADLPVAVIGGGPVGLAALARLLERGIDAVVIEAGESVGANLLDYGHVRLFSPWRHDVDPAVAARLEAKGWQAPPGDELPLAREVVERVLRPFAALPEVKSRLRLGTRVTAIAREGFDKVRHAGRETAPFVIRALQDGHPIELRARAVIDASGTWSTPNPLGANGLPALGEAEQGASLARVFGGGDADGLPARGRLGASLAALHAGGGLEFVGGFHLGAVTRERDALTVTGTLPDGRTHRIEGLDEIVCATGQRPDLATTRELRVALDPALESVAALGPLIDPNLHSCGTVRPHGHRELGHPEQGFYTVGVKSYGRAPTFLMATGFEQVRSVVAAIAGDLEAADRVELELPQTGVCSVGDTVAAAVGVATAAGAADAACCGPSVAIAAAPKAAEPACCGPAKAVRVVPVAAPRCCG